MAGVEASRLPGDPSLLADPATWSVIVAVGALIVSALAAASARRSLKNQQAMLELQMRNNIIDWANEVVRALQECIDYCSARSLVKDDLTRLSGRLSELIDRGRWFFPNLKTGYGWWKPGAFEGHAPPVISIVKCAYKDFGKLKRNTSEGVRNALVDRKRDFVSEIQSVLPGGTWATGSGG